jgi:hypothetical protein
MAVYIPELTSDVVGVLQDAQTPRDGVSVAVTSMIEQSVLVPPTSMPILYADIVLAAMMFTLQIFLYSASSSLARKTASNYKAHCFAYQPWVKADRYHIYNRLQHLIVSSMESAVQQIHLHQSPGKYTEELHTAYHVFQALSGSLVGVAASAPLPMWRYELIREVLQSQVLSVQVHQ